MGVQANPPSENHSSVFFCLPPNDRNTNRLPVSRIMLFSHVPPFQLPISIFRLSLRSTDRLRRCFSLCTGTRYRYSQRLLITLNRLFNTHFQARQVNENESHVLSRTTPTSLAQPLVPGGLCSMTLQRVLLLGRFALL